MRVRDVISETVGGHPALDSIILLASELATNSLRHSGSRFFGLGIARTAADHLRVTVADEGRTGFPCLRDESLEAEGGRGMRILDTTVNLWGITREPGIGVAVWFDYSP